MTQDLDSEAEFESKLKKLQEYAESIFADKYRLMLASETHAGYQDTDLSLKMFTHSSSELEAKPQFLRNILERLAPNLGGQPGMTWKKQATSPVGSHYNVLTVEGVLELHASRLLTTTEQVKKPAYRRYEMLLNPPLFPFKLPEVLDGLRLSAVIEHLPTRKGLERPKIFRVGFYDQDMLMRIHEIDMLPYYDQISSSRPDMAAQAPEVIEQLDIPLLGEEDVE